MENTGVNRLQSQNMVEILEFTPDFVISKTILSKPTSIISSPDPTAGFIEKRSTFDTFIQMICGKVKIMIEGKLKLLETGDGIIVPARQSYSIEEMNVLTSVRL
jgi:hypothetical protein